jgi:60S ribosomal subunit assembly/export protein LOC1
MAPSRSSSRNSSKKSGLTKANKGSSTKSKLGSKSKVAMKAKAPPPVQQKTKSQSGPVKKKRRVYTDKELGLPKLNMITPVGVDLPKGKKKGKVFVDDQVSVRLLHLSTPVVRLIDFLMDRRA